MTTKNEEPLTLIYDIETTPLLSFHFPLGKTVMRHGGLMDGYFSRHHIICIQYRWTHEKRTKILTWGESIEDEKKMVMQFSKLLEAADIIIGKNNKRFDNKHITTHQMWHGLPQDPSWLKNCDDLETQMRKHFALPSYSLDYLSAQLNLGGKLKMSFDDWKDISLKRIVDCTRIKGKEADNVLTFLCGKDLKEVMRDGKKAEDKMFEYGMKDTTDTLKLWEYCKNYCTPKFNYATYKGDVACTRCGSTAIHKNGTRASGTSKEQRFYCTAHGGHAGYATILSNGGYGKMRG